MSSVRLDFYLWMWISLISCKNICCFKSVFMIIFQVLISLYKRREILMWTDNSKDNVLLLWKINNSLYGCGIRVQKKELGRNQK